MSSPTDKNKKQATQEAAQRQKKRRDKPTQTKRERGSNKQTKTNEAFIAISGLAKGLSNKQWNVFWRDHPVLDFS
eukprot:3942983-Amphidinium_carterae.1